MKKLLGQAETLNFILMFLIVTILVISAFFWGRPILEKNIDRNRLLSAEQFMYTLDNKIQSVAKFGGKDVIKFDFGKLELLEGEDEFDDTLIFSFPITLEMSDQWFYLNTLNLKKTGNLSDTMSILRERKRGDLLEIHLFYRIRTNGNGYFIDLFAEGNKIASESVIIERNETTKALVGEKEITVTKVKLIFS